MDDAWMGDAWMMHGCVHGGMMDAWWMMHRCMDR